MRGQGVEDSQSYKLWAQSSDRPKDIPVRPDKTYLKSGWINWGDWLGVHSGRRGSQDYLPFEESRRIVRGLGLKTQAEWYNYARSSNRHPGIPSSPEGIYAGLGWSGIGDWLGTGAIAPHKREYRKFEDARKFVRTLSFKTKAEWEVWAASDERPSDIPKIPWSVYKKNGWKVLGDWLGNGKKSRGSAKTFKTFEQSRIFMRSRKLTSTLPVAQLGSIGEQTIGYPKKSAQFLQRERLERIP